MVYIEKTAFRLKGIVPDGVVIEIKPGTLNINSSAFYNCSSVASVVIPDTVTTIGEKTFFGCSALKSITMPDSITSIGYYAFTGCTKLANVSLPNNITYIPYSIFKDCTSLTSIIIPNSVASINYYAFSGCTELKSIVVPKSVKNISQESFENCNNLTTVFYTGSQIEWRKLEKNSENSLFINATIYYNYVPNADKVQITSIILKNMDSEPISSIPNNDFLAETTLKNNACTTSFTILLATYDKDGRMLHIRYLYATPAVGQTISFGTEFSNSDGKIAKIKAFALSDLRNFSVLCPAAEWSSAGR